MNWLTGFINKGSDESLLKSLFTSMGLLKNNEVLEEELIKAKNDRTKLVPKQIVAHGPNGRYITTVYVSLEELKNQGHYKPKRDNKKKQKNYLCLKIIGKLLLD